jgi:hypothetical protein
LQGFAIYHHRFAGRRQRSDVDGCRDNAPARHADIPSRAGLVDAGIEDANSWRTYAYSCSANVSSRTGLVEAGIADANTRRTDTGSSAFYTDLVYAPIACLQRAREGCHCHCYCQGGLQLVGCHAHFVAPVGVILGLIN